MRCKCGNEMVPLAHSDGWTCGCGGYLSGKEAAMGKWQPPTQEADGHFRRCARLGKCGCPPGARR